LHEDWRLADAGLAADLTLIEMSRDSFGPVSGPVDMPYGQSGIDASLVVLVFRWLPEHSIYLSRYYESSMLLALY